MKKTNLIVILLTLLTQSLCGQLMKKKDLDIMVGPELVLPNLNFRKTYYTGFGLSAKFEYMVGKHSSLTGGLAGYFLPAKKPESQELKNLFPLSIKAGGRYFFGNFYGIAEAGALLFTQQENNRSFLYAVGIGDKLQVRHQIFDLNLRYEAWPAVGRRTSLLSLGVAYQFAIH